MQLSSFFRIAATALLVTACDGSPNPLIAGIGGATAGGSIAVSPNQATVTTGGTIQLSTNVAAADANSIEWSSSASTIAAVSPSGLVTGIAAGSATIVARLATDTTQSGSATITVTP
jgi:uncharacterized protein YjdB